MNRNPAGQQSQTLKGYIVLAATVVLDTKSVVLDIFSVSFLENILIIWGMVEVESENGACCPAWYGGL